jgi:anti-sigma-K factor RskA
MTDTSAPHHHDVDDLLGVYALDALEPDEAAAVAAHVATCPRCRAELDAHREMAAALGNTVVALPPDLWDRIAERVGERPDERPRNGAGRAGNAGDSGELVPFTRATLRPKSTGAPHAAGTSARPTRRRPAVVLVGVAAMVALVAFLTVSVVEANHQLGSAQQALTDQRATAAVQAALTTPGHQLVSLRSPAGRQVAEVVVVPDGRGYFVSSAMPALPADETYQLWAMFGSRAVSLGLMGDRPAQVVFTVASGSPTQLAVTVEPAGGLARPDRLPIASGSLDA